MTKDPAKDAEMNLLTSAVSTLVAAGEVNLRLATQPSAGPRARVLLLERAEQVYEGALDLMEELMAEASYKALSVGTGMLTRPESNPPAGQGADELAHLLQWQELLDTYARLHYSIQDDLRRIRELVVSERQWRRASDDADRVIAAARRGSAGRHRTVGQGGGRRTGP